MKHVAAKKISSRVFGLDIYRALAIVLVVFVHGGMILNNTFLDGFPWIKMLDGVDLFFVLSGYLIGKLLLVDINKRDHYRLGNLLTFWKRRWFRTLPNYYLILLVNFFIVRYGLIHEDIHQFNWKFFFFLQNFSTPFTGFFWESWSLSIEEWFYLITPILLLLALRFFSPKNSFILAAVVMIVAPLIYRITQFNPTFDQFQWDISVRKVVLTRLDSIGYGLIAAWIFYYHEDFWKKYRYYFLFAGISMIYIIVHYRVPSNTIHMQIVHFTIVPISAMLLLPFAEYIRNAKGFVVRAVAHVSKISYSMYLLNLAVIAEVFRDQFPTKGDWDGVFKYLLYWIILIFASTLLYKYFELPVMNMRDKPLTFQSVKNSFKRIPFLKLGQTEKTS